MKRDLNKGQLTTWKDERGFGFIKPNDGSKEVFLHISALKGAGRRPQIGDTILYEKVAQTDGKVRAAKASIQGVVTQLQTKQKPKKQSLLKTIIGMGIFAVIIVLGIQSRNRSPDNMAAPDDITSIPKPGCNIKGNISIATGNKLYHLPGMDDYEITIIDERKGEKWFCTESEAIAQGWRKAPK